MLVATKRVGNEWLIVISSSTLNMLDSGKLAYKINTEWMQMS